MSALADWWRDVRRPQSPAEVHAVPAVSAGQTGQAVETSSNPSPARPVTITPDHAQHILNLVTEYGAAIRQQGQYAALADKFPANRGGHERDAEQAQAMSRTYYAEIEANLTTVMPADVTTRILNALKEQQS